MKRVSQTILSFIIFLKYIQQSNAQPSSQIQMIEQDVAVPSKSQMVMAAAASCLAADQYTFNYSDPSCYDCPAGTYRSIP